MVERSGHTGKIKASCFLHIRLGALRFKILFAQIKIKTTASKHSHPRMFFLRLISCVFIDSERMREIKRVLKTDKSMEKNKKAYHACQKMTVFWQNQNMQNISIPDINTPDEQRMFYAEKYTSAVSLRQKRLLFFPNERCRGQGAPGVRAL